MALPSSLIFAIFSATLSSFLFGYNIGVINAPRVVVAQWIRKVRCERNGGVADQENATDIWCRHYEAENASNVMFKENDDLNTIWSLISAIFCLGAFCSAIFLSFFVNRFGRRGTLLLNNITSIVGSICMIESLYVASYELLIVGRFIIGLNSGLNSAVPPMYLTEISNARIRGAVGTVHSLGNVFALFISQILGLPQFLGTHEGWSFLFGFSLIISVIQLCTLPFCPESPRHLYLNKNDLLGARRALEYFKQEPTEEMSAMEKEYEVQQHQPKVTIANLFTDRLLRRAILICIVAMLSQQYSGINAVMFYSSSIFTSAGMDSIVALYATVAMGGIFTLATIVAVFAVERFGRRPLLLSGLIGDAVTTVMLVIFMVLSENGSEWASYLSMISVFMFVIFFAIAPGPVPWFLSSELFTAGARSSATCVVAGVNWASALLITFCFPLVEKATGEYTFLFFTGFLVLCVIFLFVKMPETRGKTIDEIQIELKKHL